MRKGSHKTSTPAPPFLSTQAQRKGAQQQHNIMRSEPYPVDVLINVRNERKGQAVENHVFNRAGFIQCDHGLQ